MNTPAIIATSIGALLLVITALVTFLVFPAQPNPIIPAAALTTAQPPGIMGALENAQPPGTMGALENAQPHHVIVVTVAPTTAPLVTAAPPPLRAPRMLWRQPTTNFDARTRAFINAVKTRRQKRMIKQAYSNVEKELKGEYISNPVNYIRELGKRVNLRILKSMVPGYTPHSRKASSRRR